MLTLEEKWDNMFKKLIEYKKNNDTLLVSYKTDLVLYSWTMRQIKQYKLGTISNIRIKKLNDIGYDFNDEKLMYKTRDEIVITLEKKWDNMCNKLFKYKHEYNTFIVNYKTNLTLYSWITSQIKQYKNNELSDIRIKKLNDIGYDFNDEKRTYKTRNEMAIVCEKKWDNMCKKLSEYKCKYNTFVVNTTNDVHLYNWLGVQLKQHKDGTISDIRIKKLNDIEYDFNNVKRIYSKWDEMYKELINYKNDHGTLNVKFSDKKLYFWFKKQGRLYRNGNLSKERIDKLNDISFNFKPTRIINLKTKDGVIK